MAKGYFSQLSNCEPKPFVFNLRPIFGIKIYRNKLLYSCHNSATFKPNKWPKNEPKQAKRIGLVCNLVTAYSLHSFSSNDHISLVSTLNRKLFVALDS